MPPQAQAPALPAPAASHHKQAATSAERLLTSSAISVLLDWPTWQARPAMPLEACTPAGLHLSPAITSKQQPAGPALHVPVTSSSLFLLNWLTWLASSSSQATRGTGPRPCQHLLLAITSERHSKEPLQSCTTSSPGMSAREARPPEAGAPGRAPPASAASCHKKQQAEEACRADMSHFSCFLHDVLTWLASSSSQATRGTGPRPCSASPCCQPSCKGI